MPLSETRQPPAGHKGRVLLAALGSRGDIQPFCVLGRALQRAGYSASVFANDEYRSLVEGHGLRLAPESPAGLGELFFSPDMAALFDQYAGGWRRIFAAPGALRTMQEAATRTMLGCLPAVRGADLVVFNSFAFFAGVFARELGLPAIRLAAQPLLPSRREPLCIFGGRPLGPLGNRLSYEVLRLLPLTIARRPLREVRTRSDLGERLRGCVNPLTLGLTEGPNLLAFSPVLARDPGDWPRPYRQTGFLFSEPDAGAALPGPVAAFLAAGPPPVYVGFGSMSMNPDRNTELVLEAVRRARLRAILARGAGGLRPADPPPPGVLTVGAVDHGLLFPHVSAVVHHGGSGTTAAALRHGRPSVVLPLLGDQLFWGRRVAAIEAGPNPIPLGRSTPDGLAAAMSEATRSPRWRAGAERAAAGLRRDPGVAGAVGLVEEVVGARAAQAIT